MNERSLSCTELCNIAYDLNVVKIRSEKMYAYIVLYFEKMQFTAADLKMNIQLTVRFLKSIAINYG